MEYTEEELAGLTEEEREALLEDDGSDGADDGEEGDGDGEGDEGDDDAGDEGEEGEEGADGADGEAAEDGDADADADADAAEGSEADDEPADAGIAATEQAPAPRELIDFNTQLATIEAALEKIEEQYDEGELTAKERRQQVRTLEDQRVELIVLQREAHNEVVREAQERDRVVNGFLSEVGITKDVDDPMFAAFDKCVIKVANDPTNAELSARAILEKSHALLRKQFGLAEPAPKATAQGKKPPARPKPPTVPSLAKVPAAAATATDEGNRFSHLDRLDPVAREEAVAKMSDSERDSYLMYA